MSAKTTSDHTELPLDVLDKIHQICDRFEAAWEAGEQPRIEDYLGQIAEPYRLAVLRDLLAAELNARSRRGEQPGAAEYAARCPQHAEQVLHMFLDRELTEAPKSAAEQRSVRRGDTDANSEPAGAGHDPQKLGGYRIERELGRGGMGVVYEAFDEKNGAIVALKTLNRADPAAILRFKQEFRALADVFHPNLVVLHELIVDGPSWFFTMELVDGVDFLSFVRSGTDPPVPVAKTADNLEPPSASLPAPCRSATDDFSDTDPFDPNRIGAGSEIQPCRRSSLSPAVLARLRIALLQLAEGVAVLHEAGKLHRDLKPSNVMVTRQGRLVILDFGLAADLGASGLHESLLPYVLGTSFYMAPEQAAGLAVSPASDWYSLGSMLYEVLTGHTPFLGRPLEVLMDKQRFEPPAPSELVPGLPDDLNALCVDLLRRDPAARPTGRDVLLRLGSKTGEPRLLIPVQPSGHQPPPLVGRDRDLESLTTAFADVGRGQTVALFIHGSSGVGKTALARRFLDDLIDRDQATVLAGRCYEQESVPFKALDSVVDALSQVLKRLPLLDAQTLLPNDLRSLVRVFPVLREAESVATTQPFAAPVPDPQELRRRAFRALRELLIRLGERRPLVVAIDDLQWGDSDSAVLLAELLRLPDPPRLLLLGCYRSDDAATSPLVRALLEDNGAGPRIERRVLALATLEPTDALGLALTLLGGEDQAASSHAAAIARESCGNPFFVAELVRYVQADIGLLRQVPVADELALDEVLWARLRRLPEEARRLLEVVAVSGRPLGRADASRAAELGASEQRVLPILRSGRLIRSTGPPEQDEIETYHDRVREAVVAHIPPAALEGHHRRLARVLESSGRADPEVLAIHFHGSRQHELAGTYYAQAAAEAGEALAFDRAAKLYRLALELRTGDDTEERRLRIGLADALANAGRGAEAAREYLDAAIGASAADTLERRRCAALQYLISGHIDEGLAQLGAVLKAVGMTIPATPRRAILSLILNRIKIRLRGLHFRPRDASQISAEDLTRLDICWSAASGLGFVDPIRGGDFQARGLLLALRAGDAFRIGRALCFEAGHVSAAGGPGERRAAKLVRAAEQIAHQLDNPHLQGGVLLAQGMAAYLTGQWKRAGEFHDRAGVIFRTRCTGITFEVDWTILFSLWSLQYRGELAELGRRWPVALKEALERGDRHMVTLLNTFLMSTLRLAADDPEGAEDQLRQALGQWTQRGFHSQHNEWYGALVQIKLYRGDGKDAWRFFTERYQPSLARSHLTRIQRLRIFFYERRARCALAAVVGAADPGPLVDAAERDARRLEREGMAWSLALACPIKAGVAAARGDTSHAVKLFALAVNQLEAVDMHLYAAASRRRLGEILGGDEGKAQVDRADTWMREKGIKNPARMADVFAAVVDPGATTMGASRGMG
jgi:eukaryotic-like serine/threonine-protein kinase